jgi:hypothetical protein
VLGITALVAAWRTSLIAATTIIAIVLSLGSAALRWDLLVAAASLFAIAGTLFAAAGGTSVLRLFEVGMREVEDEPLSLPCPLLALRAPRDEASLIIGLGQVVQGLWHAAARFVVLAARPLGRRLAPPGSDGTDELYLVLVAAMCLLVLVGGWFNLWTPPSLKEAGWFQWGIAHLKAGLLLSGVVGLVGLLAWALPTMAISLATGREAFMLPAATLVEAEPLPNARASDGRGPAENGARNPLRRTARWPEPFAIRRARGARPGRAVAARTGWCAGSRPMPHAVNLALDPANPLHRALLRLESGLAMAEIASPVPRTRSMVFAAAINATGHRASETPDPSAYGAAAYRA